MPFICSEPVEKEQTKHIFYVETGINATCSWITYFNQIL